MEFEWDEKKHREDLLKHGVDFNDAVLIFENEYVEAPETDLKSGEVRWCALGEVRGHGIVVVYTWRGKRRRIISAWKVGTYGKKRYQALLTYRH